MVQIPTQTRSIARLAEAANAPYEHRDQGPSEAIPWPPSEATQVLPPQVTPNPEAVLMGHLVELHVQQQVSTLHAMLASQAPPSLPVQPRYTTAAPLPLIIPSLMSTE